MTIENSGVEKLPRDEWLATEGRVLYNSLGDTVMSVLEVGRVEAPQLESLEGSIEDVSLAMGRNVDLISGYITDTVFDRIQPQRGINFSVNERARDYLSESNQEVGVQESLQAVDLMVVEGLTTSIVMSSKFSILALQFLGRDENITAGEVADMMINVEQMLLTASTAGQAFWSDFSVPANLDQDTDAYDIDAMTQAFLGKFQSISSDDINSLDDVMLLDSEQRLQFTEPARKIMQEYRKKFNDDLYEHPDGHMQRTGNCPVTLGRLSLREASPIVYSVDAGDYGPSATQALTTRGPIVEDGVIVGHEATIEFDPLIPRANRHFAELIRAC